MEILLANPRGFCAGVDRAISIVERALDIFEAPDIEAATKVATIIRTFGHARTEIWAATEWDRFTEIVRYLPPAKAAKTT